MKRIYLDSNVFISVLKEEIGRNVRGLFVEAGQFFEKVKQEKHVIVLSDWFFEEVIENCFTDINGITEYLKNLGVQLEIVKKQNPNSRELIKLGLHYSDAVHAAIALQNKCDCIVTFNIKDFEKVSHKIEVFSPEEF
ncbi:MAG: type II toxin-antitoxin system VapC family toxin [archaeon]